MKITAFLSFILAFTLSMSLKPAEDKNAIIGKWEIKEGHMVEYISFNEDGSLELKLINNLEKGAKYSYEIDDTQKPFKIDLVMEAGSKRKAGKCIYRFPSPNTLEICGFDKGSSAKRPKDFNEEDSVLFTKIK